jgi:hypothetical protein
MALLQTGKKTNFKFSYICSNPFVPRLQLIFFLSFFPYKTQSATEGFGAKGHPKELDHIRQQDPVHK